MTSEKTSAKNLAHAFYLLEENGVLVNIAAVGGEVILDTEGAEDDRVRPVVSIPSKATNTFLGLRPFGRSSEQAAFQPGVILIFDCGRFARRLPPRLSRGSWKTPMPKTV